MPYACHIQYIDVILSYTIYFTISQGPKVPWLSVLGACRGWGWLGKVHGV